MAFSSRLIDAPAEAVFAVLADPHTYPDWLLGAAVVRDADHNWPSPGSVFHHTVGIRPFALSDTTMVRDVEPNRSLRLSVRARPLITAEVEFRIVPDGDRCVVTMQEEPSFRMIGNLVRPVMDPVTHVRNHRSLQQLDELVARRGIERVPA